MLDLLQHLFAAVCGQNPDHTWSPGGVLLPCCQRCTGLYLGAFVAGLLHLWRRPYPNSGWLWLNGGYLMFMVPFGFHWLPQDAVLRTATGVLFGFGLVAFLSLTLGRAVSPLPEVNPDAIATRHAWEWLPHLAALIAMLVLVPWLGLHGSGLISYLLALPAALGVLVLSGLALFNVTLALRKLIRCFINRTGRQAA